MQSKHNAICFVSLVLKTFNVRTKINKGIYSISIFIFPGATKDMGKMLGGEEEKDPDAAKKEEERQEALRQQEEERKAKHARMEAEREKVRQTIRDKVRKHLKGSSLARHLLWNRKP